MKQTTPPDMPTTTFDGCAPVPLAHYLKALGILRLVLEQADGAARGIWQGDEIPAVSIGELKSPKIALDLSFMQMGEGEHGPSWLARTVALRDRLGPFRLALLETVLRAVDAIASRNKNVNNVA
jgi:hypothetical protein